MRVKDATIKCPLCGEPLTLPVVAERRGLQAVDGTVRYELTVDSSALNEHVEAHKRETTHACPPKGAPVTPCCGRTPFELPRWHRMTLDSGLVTCGRG